MAETIERILSNVSNDFDKSQGSFIYDATKAVSIEIDEIYKDIDLLKKQQWLENLSDEELTRRVFERTGIQRHQATFATTSVIVTGIPGTNVRQGEKVASNTSFYSFLEDFTIPVSGTIEAHVISDLAGVIGNTAAETITSFPVTIEGVHSVTNIEPVTNGFPQESNEDLLKRYFEYLQLPSTSGNKAHYKSWAKEVVGVGDARVFPTWQGGGTVKVTIINTNRKGADEDLINLVYNHIEEVRPIGATVTVASANEKKINVSATLSISPNYNMSQINDTIKTEIEKYFASVAFNEDYISYAKIGNVILNVDGVRDYTNLTLNLSTENITLGEEEIPVLESFELEV